MSPDEKELERLIDAVTEGQPRTRAAIGKMIAVVVASAERHARNEALQEAAKRAEEYPNTGLLVSDIRALKR